MKQTSFKKFAAEAQAQGFDEVLERRWAPFTVLESHTHAFSLKAMLIQGEMWLTVGSEERQLRRGDEFALERDEPHAERYGSEGATYWVARRNC